MYKHKLLLALVLCAFLGSSIHATSDQQAAKPTTVPLQQTTASDKYPAKSDKQVLLMMLISGAAACLYQAALQANDTGK